MSEVEHQHESRISKLEAYQDSILTNNDNLLNEIRSLRTDLKDVVSSISMLTNSVSKTKEIEVQCAKLERDLIIITTDLTNYNNQFSSCKEEVHEMVSELQDTKTNVSLMTGPLKWIVNLIALATAAGVGAWIASLIG